MYLICINSDANLLAHLSEYSIWLLFYLLIFCSEQNQRPTPPTPQRAPINKQIETRTPDGKRRITPMFIPPIEGYVCTVFVMTG